MEEKNPLSRQIKELRKRSGLPQREFAVRAGVGLRFLRELEQGKPSVRLDKVNAVLNFFGHHLEIISNHDPRAASNSGGPL